MNPFKGRHFQRDIILWAVRWYCKYGISYRELQEMLAERGVNVDHSTIYRWVQRYAPEMEKRLRWYWRNPSDLGVVCGRGRNPTLRLWPTIFSGKIDVFPGDRRSRLISSMTSVAPA